MSRICYITQKKRVVGSRISRKGQSKKSGGIGTHVTKKVKRVFKPNLQRIYIRLPQGQVKRVWVAVKAIKAGLVEKVVGC
jgi:large subunit ribosomal protein L28